MVVVIVGIDNFQSQRLGVTCAFVLAYVIFVKRINVGVAVVNCRADAVLHQTLNYGRRARSATSVEQHLLCVAGYMYLKFLFHLDFF